MRPISPELVKRLRRADPTARLMVEAVATEAEALRVGRTITDPFPRSEWRLADGDTTLAFRVRQDAGLELQDDLDTPVEQTAADDYLLLPLPLPLQPTLHAARIEWPQSNSAERVLRTITLRLDPQLDSQAPQEVSRWAVDVYRVVRFLDSIFQVELQPIWGTLYQDAAGPSAGDVTFTFPGDPPKVGPAPLRQGQSISVVPVTPAPGEPGNEPAIGGGGAQPFPNPITVIVVRPLKADGAPAGNAGWAIDSEHDVYSSTGTLTHWSLQQTTRGAYQGSYRVDLEPSVPYIVVRSGLYQPGTITFAANPIDLGLSPAHDVELVGQGESPAGSSIVYEVQADDAAWVQYFDGDLVATDNRPQGGADLRGVSLRQSYAVRATLTPPTPAVSSPILRAIGARAVDRLLLDGEATAQLQGSYAVDPVTFAGEVPEVAITIPRTGEQDYRDVGTELLSRYDLASLSLRLWVGDPALGRAHWLHVDDYLVDDYDTDGPALVIYALSPLVLTRVSIPPATGTGEDTQRQPKPYPNTPLSTVYQDLLASQIGLAERYRGPGIPDSVTYTVSNTVADVVDGKAALDAIARLAGGATISSQGRVRFVDLLGEREAVAVLPSEELKATKVTPGFRQRIPEYFVPYGWSEERGDFDFESRAFDANSLAKLGSATLDAPQQLDRDVARWIDTSDHATWFGGEMVRRLGLGLLLWTFQTSYPYPELEPGDVVVVQTDRFVARDPLSGQAIRGQIWARGVVVGVPDLLGRQISIWVRSYTDITAATEVVDRSGLAPSSVTDILAVDFVASTGSTRTYQVRRGAAVEQARVHWVLYTGNLPDGWLEDLYSDDHHVATLLVDGDSFITPQPAEGQVLAYAVTPWAETVRGTFVVIGQGIEGTVEGGLAPVDFSATFARLGSATERIDVTLHDPRGVVAQIVVYETLRGTESGPFTATVTEEGTYSHTYTLDPDHVRYLRVVALRSDGGEPLVRAYAADVDQVPGIPTVSELRIVDEVTLNVDAADTDAASLWYRPVLDGEAGADVEIAPRGSDPRFGAFTFEVGEEELRFQVFAKNGAGEAGDYRDVRVAPFVSAVDTRYVQVVAVLVASDATTVTVAVSAEPAGAEVYLYGLAGSAARVSGPALGVPSPSGTEWVFSRGAIGAGAAQARFRGEYEGYQDDDDLVTIEEQGRDTVPLLVRARVIATAPDEITVEVAAADPYPGGAISIGYLAEGLSGVTPTSPRTILADAVTSDIATTGVVQFTVPRPASGAGTGRLTITATRAGRTADADAVDVPEQQPPVMHEEVSEDGTTGTLTLTPLTGAVFDTVEFATRSGNGAWSGWVEDASSPYTAAVTLDAKHSSAIAYRVSRSGVVIQQRVVAGFDIGTIADVLTFHATPNGTGTANLRAAFDADAVVGAEKARYRVDGGSPVTLTIAADRTAVWSLAQSETTEKLVEVQAQNAGGTWGPWISAPLPRYVPPARAAGILSVDVDEQWSGNCATGVPLTNRVSVEFFGVEEGDTWTLLRIENGSTQVLVATGIPISTTVKDDEVDVEDAPGVGALVSVVYRVILNLPGPALDPERDTPAISQEWMACS